MKKRLLHLRINSPNWFMSKFETHLENYFNVLELYYNNKEILINNNIEPFFWGEKLILFNKSIKNNKNKHEYINQLIVNADCILYDSFVDMRELFNNVDLIFFFDKCSSKKCVEYKIDTDGDNICLDENLN